MPTKNHPFVWYELMTGNVDASVKFYSNVFGWKARDAGLADRRYVLLSTAAGDVGGMLDSPGIGSSPSSHPFWLGYIAAAVDADIARVVAAGGAVRRPAEDIPEVGRFAVVTDPYGAAFVLFSGTSAQPPASVPADTPGHIGWHELYSEDGERAFAFYSKLFGWTKGDAMDMGPNGVYQIFAINDVPCGGMMNRMPDMPASSWTFYVNVDGIDAAISRVAKSGGRIVMGPHQVPGDLWIAQGLDPQGGPFAMLSPKK